VSLTTEGQYSNIHKKKISTSGIVKLDEKSIVPNSIILPELDSNYYSIDYFKAKLTWLKKVRNDSIFITYRTFPLSFYAPIRRFNYDSVSNNFITKKTDFSPQTSAESFLNFGNLNYNGSFGRSLSVGNSQDAVFNSQLNLQISGLIGDSIQLNAAITDNNIPIQPDGTTQQLNEFDKILLQFKRKDWELNLGDIDIRQSNNYFLKFYKRLQGISYGQQSSFGKYGSNKLLLSGAIAKGKFTRNIFQGKEGNQGPYRLQGANNELYFVVLANTEHVFIDGELMQRGEDQDYIINYNSAEITFTPKRMITKDKRIQIEFEYADRNYLNSLLYANDEVKLNKKLTIAVGVYQNSDAKNSPINQSLDSTQKRFLVSLGDSIQNAFYPNASIDTFSSSKILYTKIPIQGTNDSFYQYSTQKDSARYSLSFVEVGANKGNYVPYFNGANGKVYQYVSPINGIKQGNYEPAIYLVTPKKQQLFNITTNYEFSKHTSLTTDVAVSNYDVNTYSSKEKSDNTGIAMRALLKKNGNVSFQKRKLSYTSTIGYEYIGKQFKPLERLRSVEFVRDWGLPLNTNVATEHLPKMLIELKDSNNNRLSYSIASYLRSDNFKGVRQLVQHVQTIKTWQTNTEIALTNNESNTGKGYYFKPSVDISKTFPHLKQHIIGGGYTLENNVIHVLNTDSLSPNSFHFDVISAYIKSNQTKANKWSFLYNSRADKQAVNNRFLQINRSHNYNLLLELMQHQHQKLRTSITYRELTIQNISLTNLTPDKSLLSRSELFFNKWKGFFTGNALYEIGAGQEQQRDLSYLQVQTGRGDYAWIDYNNDGIQQLNEFENARFSDQAKFIRLYTPTNVYIKSNYSQFNYSVLLSPKELFLNKNKLPIHNFISRFNLLSALQVAKKVVATDAPMFNPFNAKINDDKLLTYNFLFSNTLSLNRFSSVWGIDINNIRNFNKSLLTYGFESKQLTEWNMKARANFDRKFTVELLQKLGNNTLTTPSFSNRNYAIKSIGTEPKLSFINATLLRVQANYAYLQKQNAEEFGGEKSVSNAFGIETKLNAVQNSSLTAKFTLNNIQFDGSANTTVSYLMLEGLSVGKNYLWNLDFTKRLINNLELSFNYEGRKPGDNKVVHIGRASLRALF